MRGADLPHAQPTRPPPVAASPGSQAREAGAFLGGKKSKTHQNTSLLAAFPSKSWQAKNVAVVAGVGGIFGPAAQWGLLAV